MSNGLTGWPMRFREHNVAWSLKARESFFPKSARKNSTVNCAGFGSRLNNDKAALPFLILAERKRWQPVFWFTVQIPHKPFRRRDDNSGTKGQALSQAA